MNISQRTYLRITYENRTTGERLFTSFEGNLRKLKSDPFSEAARIICQLKDPNSDLSRGCAKTNIGYVVEIAENPYSLFGDCWRPVYRYDFNKGDPLAIGRLLQLVA